VESLEAIGNTLAYGAALLLVAAVAMTTVRRMRVLALCAGVLAIGHLAITHAPIGALALALLFVLVNLVQLVGMWRRSRSGEMLAEERALFDHLLGASAAQHQGRLRDLMQWRMLPAGQVVIEQGDVDPPLFYIASGRVLVEADGIEVGTCGEGDFLGEMSLLSGHSATARVTVVEAARIARFDRDALAQYARAVPEVGTAFTNAMNRGLTAKVERMNRAATRTKQ
jgi:hypothetical protein